ncbi:MAG TPA: type II toxin-antitoxin system RelE/ParE family toxin [Acetobacteraceae bacterium]|nr:type II toxin-antitoxin system RelE/ParE family toxin [Acetobacteraceae bacterium]
MPSVSRADRAEDDLLEIADYISRDNPFAARRLLVRIEAMFDLIGRNPLIGRSRPDIAPDARAFPVGRYLILYRLTQDGVEIVRIVHGARYLPGLL